MAPRVERLEGPPLPTAESHNLQHVRGRHRRQGKERTGGALIVLKLAGSAAKEHHAGLRLAGRSCGREERGGGRTWTLGMPWECQEKASPESNLGVAAAPKTQPTSRALLFFTSRYMPSLPPPAPFRQELGLVM